MKTLADLLALADQSTLYAIDGVAYDLESQPAASRNGHPLEPVGDPVATIFEKQQLDTLQLDVLGELASGSVRVFSGFHHKTFEIHSVDRLSYETLLQIAGPPVKEHVNRSTSDRHIEGRFPLAEVKDAISLLSGYKRIDDQTELGAGCWRGRSLDGAEYPSVVIVGDTEAVEWNGIALERITHPRCRGHILNFNSITTPWYRFDTLEKNLRATSDQGFCLDAINDAFNLFSRWRWKNPTAGPIVTTGMILATWVQTIWDWRPQVAIIGATNTGKTTFFQCLDTLFGNIAIRQSGSSAAGIRQSMRGTAQVVLCDEFEKNKQRQEILEMLRLSGRGDRKLMGTTNQRGTGFLLQHIIWVAAIESGLRDEADRNRFITQELVRIPEREMSAFALPPPDELHDLGQRLLACAVVYVNAARAMATKLKNQTDRLPGVNRRIIESYAVPAAMLSVIQGFDIDKAAMLLAEMVVDSATQSQEIADEANLLQAILNSQVHTGRTMLSVAQLLTCLDSTTAHNSAKENAVEMLGKSGLMVGWHDGQKCLSIAHGAVGEHLLAKTRWGFQAIEQILRRLTFVASSHSRQRVGGHLQYCVVLNYEKLKSEFLGDEEISENLMDDFMP